MHIRRIRKVYVVAKRCMSGNTRGLEDPLFFCSEYISNIYVYNVFNWAVVMLGGAVKFFLRKCLHCLVSCGILKVQ